MISVFVCLCFSAIVLPLLTCLLNADSRFHVLEALLGFEAKLAIRLDSLPLQQRYIMAAMSDLQELHAIYYFSLSAGNPHGLQTPLPLRQKQPSNPSSSTTYAPVDDNVQMLQVTSHDGISPSNSNEYQPSHIIQDDFSGLDPNGLPSYTDRRTKKILLKFDTRMIPMLAVLLQFSFMDKGNILNGQISGLTTTLELSNRKYKAGLVLFFFGYATWGIPSMVILKKVKRPVTLLTATVIVWGVCLAGEGAVGNFVQFLIVRTILGMHPPLRPIRHR